MTNGRPEDDDDDEATGAHGGQQLELCARVAPTPISELNSKRAAGTPGQPPANNLKILHFYLTFIHYFGFSINPSDDSARQARRLSIRAKMAAASTGCSLRFRFLEPAGQRAACTPEPASWWWRRRRDLATLLRRWLRNFKWRLLKGAIKFYAISLTAFLSANHVIVLFHYIYDGEKVFTELLLELRLVITKLSALIFVISWHRNQTKVRQLIKLVKSTSSYILNEPASLRKQSTSSFNRRLEFHCKNNFDRPPPPPPPTEVSNEENCRFRRLDWRVAKWWLMCSFVTILHFSLSEAEIRNAKHLWQWLEDYSLHQLNNQTTSISSLFIMASFDNYIYTVHVYGTRLIGASVMCIVYTFQVENILHLNEQVLAALRATNTAAGPGRRSRVLDRELFFVLGESDWLQVERNRSRSPPIGWLSSTVERHLAILRAKCSQLAKSVATTLTGAIRSRGPVANGSEVAPKGDKPSRLRADCQIQIERVTPSGIAPTLARKLNQLAASSLSHGNLEPDALISKQKGGAHHDGQFPGSGDFVPNSTHPPSAPKPQTTPMSWSSAGASCKPLARRGDDCDDSNQAADHARLRQLMLTSRPPSSVVPFYLVGGQVAPSLGGRHFEGPLTRAKRLFAPSLSLVPAPLGAFWPTTSHFDPRFKLTGQMAEMGGQTEAQKLHQEAGALGQQLELHLDAMARKYELIRTVNSRIDHCFGHMLLSQYSFLFLMSCIDVVYFSLSFNPNTKTKYIIVSGMILLWFPYLLLYKFASDIGLASKKLLTSVRRLARLALVLQLSVSDSNSSPRPGGGVCESEKMQLLSLPTLRRYRLGSIASKLSAELAHHSQQQQQHTRARIFNKLDHVFKPSHLSIVGIMTMDKFFLLNFAKIVITASVMAIQFISKG